MSKSKKKEKQNRGKTFLQKGSFPGPLFPKLYWRVLGGGLGATLFQKGSPGCFNEGVCTL